MGRATREIDPERPSHVGSRGNFEQDVFLDTWDRRVWLLKLADVIREYEWTCFAWCQMTNHFHLVVEAPNGGLSEGMQVLNGGFSRWANKRHGRAGHLFENRFWSKVVEDEANLLGACRYVVRNPVRAGICSHPSAWRWSSYRATAGLEFAPELLAADRVLELFGPRPALARRAYRRFVSEGQDPVSDTGDSGAGQRTGDRPRPAPRRP